MECSSKYWPKTPQNSEQGRFTASIWSRNDAVHALFDFKIDFANEVVSVGGNYGNIVESDCVFGIDYGLSVEGDQLLFVVLESVLLIGRDY